jgi:hypothetical protein
MTHRVARMNRGLPLGSVLASGAPYTTSRPGFPTGVSVEAAGSPPPIGSIRLDSFDSVPAKRRGSRLATIVPALRALSTTQYLNEHTALVRHLQFSTNGEFCE